MLRLRGFIIICSVAACGTDAPTSVGVTASIGPYFERAMFFNQDVSGVRASPDTAQIIGSLQAAGGCGHGNHLVIDFSIPVVTADASAPMMAFLPNEMFVSPDCDLVDIPMPAGGNVEGEPGYSCDGGGDCHLLVNDVASGKLYELYHASMTSQAAFESGCVAVWDTRATYDETLRGDQCTSADAAGLPIAPLLFDADEVAAGEIDHAIRFVLPNDRIRQGFVRPATHGAYTTGKIGAPYYGVHLRLRADYPLETLPSEGARVVARAMQKYGMYHADGGEYGLTAKSDRYSSAKWSDVLAADALAQLHVGDFEVIDHGKSHALSNDCMR